MINATTNTSRDVCEEFQVGRVEPLRVMDDGAAIPGRKELQPPGNVTMGLFIESEVMVWEANSAAQVIDTTQEDAGSMNDMAGKV